MKLAASFASQGRSAEYIGKLRMSGQSAIRKQPGAPKPTEEILSWGRYPQAAHHYVHKPAWSDQVPEILKAAASGALLLYGLGRSYGDSCLNAGRELIDCRPLNRILAFANRRARSAAKAGSASPMFSMYVFRKDGSSSQPSVPLVGCRCATSSFDQELPDAWNSPPGWYLALIRDTQEAGELFPKPEGALASLAKCAGKNRCVGAEDRNASLNVAQVPAGVTS
jgi:hypothetical protein